MSYYETREQRQIRELQNQLNAANRANAQSSRIQEELSRRLRQTEKERRQHERALQESIERQQRVLENQEQRSRNLSAAVKELNREIIAQEQRHNDHIQQLHQQHEHEIRQQNERISQVAHQLQGQISQTRLELQSEISAIHIDTNRKINALEEQRRRDMDWTRQQLESTNSRISSLEQQIANHRDLADYWITQAQRLLSQIKEELRPEHFAAQQWQQLQQVVQNAVNDFNSNMYQAAASNGRDAYQEAYILRDSLIEMELEWQQTLEAVRQTESSLLENAVAAAGRIYEFEMDGEHITEDRGVDYWTYGQLSILNNRINEVRNRLNENTEELSTDDLLHFREELTGLMEELSLLENAAASNLTMAQGRFSMAQRIGSVLGDQFLMVDQDGDYFGQENRDEYHAVFHNPTTGEEAVVTITPLIGEDGIVVNHAELIVNVPTNDPKERSLINDAVVRQVAREVEGFQLPCSGQYEERTNDEARRTGNISAVSNGDEQVRSQCSRTGVTHHGVSLSNPVVRATSTAQNSTKTTMKTE